MQLLDTYPLKLARPGIAMAVWGVLLIIAAVISQWVQLPMGTFLLMWGVVTALGVLVQAMCEIQYQALNFYVWLAAFALGWAFTLFVVYPDNFAHYAELAPARLLLLGLAYAHTAVKINSRFWILSALHILAAAIFELSNRGVFKIDLLNNNGALIFGLLAGIAVLVGAYYARINIMASR